MSDKEKLDFLLANNEKAILMIAKDLIINANPLDNIQKEYLKEEDMQLKKNVL